MLSKRSGLTSMIMVLLIVMLSFLSTDLYAQSEGDLKIAPLQGKPEDGCGCGFHNVRDSKQRLIMDGYGYADVIRLNINGKDVELKETGKTQKKGKYSINTYKAGDVTAKVELYETGKGYESVDLEGTVTVIKGKNKVFIKVKGGCGC